MGPACAMEQEYDSGCAERCLAKLAAPSPAPDPPAEPKETAMNTDSVPNTPLAKAILAALVDSRAGRNYYDDTRLILRVLERFGVAEPPAEPAAPPIREPGELTLAEAVLAKINGQVVEFHKGEHGIDWHVWSDWDLPTEPEELLRIASNRYRLKPAPPAPKPGTAWEMAGSAYEKWVASSDRMPMLGRFARDVAAEALETVRRAVAAGHGFENAIYIARVDLLGEAGK